MAAVARVGAVRPAVTAGDAAPATPVAPTLASGLAAAPPIDQDRVAQIRRAVENGTFPISPARVADRLIALRLEWTGHDAA